MKRLPKANTNYNDQKQSQLVISAQSLKNGLTAQAVTFPTPPITLVAYQGFIDTYQGTLASAFKGSKTQTSNKNNAKKALIQNTKSMVQYVNQVVQDTYNTTPSVNYDSLRALILSAGIDDSKIVGRPNPSGNERQTSVINAVAKTLSGRRNVNGILRARVKGAKKYDPKANKMYKLAYRVKAVPPAADLPWNYYASTTTRIQVTGLPSGLYQIMTAGVGGVSRGNFQINWSPIQEVVVT